MSKTVYIPITDHNTGSICSLSYTVRFKLSSVPYWTTLSEQQPLEYGSLAQWVIELTPLKDDLSYDYEIYRNCCDGLISIAASGTFTSTDT